MCPIRYADIPADFERNNSERKLKSPPISVLNDQFSNRNVFPQLIVVSNIINASFLSA
jgi:hypothetical protein